MLLFNISLALAALSADGTPAFDFDSKFVERVEAKKSSLLILFKDGVSHSVECSVRSSEVSTLPVESDAPKVDLSHHVFIGYSKQGSIQAGGVWLEYSWPSNFEVECRE